MSEETLERARRFAELHGMELRDELGAGTQGVVFALRDKSRGHWSALKIHFRPESFVRERDAYLRLDELGVFEVVGFAVPKLLRVDAELLAIEMSVVARPYVLDFAGAWLDDEEPPDFPEEVWSEWEREKREQFGARWPIVQEVIAKFAAFGIHLLDVSPGNIAFRE
jgi:hypothetical protein